MRVAYHELVLMLHNQQAGDNPNEVVGRKELMGRILEDLVELDQIEQELGKLGEKDLEAFKARHLPEHEESDG